VLRDAAPKRAIFGIPGPFPTVSGKGAILRKAPVPALPAVLRTPAAEARHALAALKMPSTPATPPTRLRSWIVSPAWDLLYLVLTPLLIVPAVLVTLRAWLTTEQVYLAVISFASLGHHLPGFMRAYGDRELFQRYRWRFLLAPPLTLGLALLFTPPPALAHALGLPWTHLHGLELILAVWGTWHGLMQTYGFMRIYDLRRGENDRRTARLDQALCVAIFAAGVVFSDTRMFGLAGAMWQTGLPIFGPDTLTTLRWIVGAAAVAVGVAYVTNALSQQRRGAPINGVKLLLVGVTGWFWWYCGRISTNLLIGVAMFEIYHAVQYNAIVWIYNRRLLENARERFGPLAFLFRDRAAMLGVYLGAIAAYSSIRFFTATTEDRMFSGDLAGAQQWLIAFFVASSMLHFYYDGFIWKVSEKKTRDNLVDEAAKSAPTLERNTAALVHAGKWAVLATIAAMLVMAERQYSGRGSEARQAAERAALAKLTPAVPEAAMLASQEALARGDTRAAADLAQQAAASRPQSAQSQAEYAWTLMEAKDYAKAKVALEKALALAPNNWQYYFDLGEANEHLKDDKQAEAEYRRAMELAPDETDPHRRLAAMLLRLGRVPEAIEALETLVALDGTSAETHYRLGFAKLQQGDARHAIASLKEAVKLDPKLLEGWLQLGDAFMAIDKPQSAVAAYARAVELRPDVADAWVCWADSLLQSGLTAEAEQVLRSGLKATPDSPELNLTLGLLLQQLGRKSEAAKLLERAQQLGLNVQAAAGAN
jgi:tetratricopeptide (TPR) repeat protein